jgi:hypothetical protein
VDRKTVRKYLAAAEAAGIIPGGPSMSTEDWAKLIKSWFPEMADSTLRQITWPEIDKHRDYIKGLLGTVTVTTIHQRLRDEHGLKVSISAFRRWVHATPPEEMSRSWVPVLRREVEPGAEAQIDYGFLGQWSNPRTGKRHRIWAFVMVLPCSRHMFVRPVVHLDQHAWTEAHVEAFRYFGGAPAPAGAGQPAHRGGQAGSLRPEDQQSLRRAGRPLRRPGRPGSGRQAEGQAARRTPDALHPQP